jgi:hypothetical protein
VVCTGGVDTVFIGDDLPELGTDLVTALASLDVYDFYRGEISYILVTSKYREVGN